MDPSRRRLLRSGSLGGAGLLLGGLIGRRGGAARSAVDADPEGDGQGGLQAARAGYEHPFQPPPTLGERALDERTLPPPSDGRRPGALRLIDMPVVERTVEVADGQPLDAWTYDGTVPGPLIRATQGDRLAITLQNRTGHPHNLHLHGRHDPTQDGWEPIPPGEDFTYTVTAEPFGLYPYHCHTTPLAEHIARGLYGAMIIDPPGGRPPAREFALVLCGFDVDGDGRNEFYGWNGVAGFFERFPIKVEVGALVRLYLLNMAEYEPVTSFHLHAQTFDVFRSGSAMEPDEHTDVVTLGQGERAILEFRLPRLGRYLFHPHQHHQAERGAMGWFAAV